MRGFVSLNGTTINCARGFGLGMRSWLTGEEPVGGPEHANPALPPTDHIQGLSRGLAILEYVRVAPHPVGVKEIAGAGDLKLGTA
ncbi:MAG: hypothetical protein ACRDPC_29300 [Solirubrobacteraceae bacterium]